MAVDPPMQAVLASLIRFLDREAASEIEADVVLRARLRDFIVTRLAAGFFGAAAFPIWLAAGAPLSLFGALTFVWLLAPLLLVVYLARTGELTRVHICSSVTSTGLFVWLALMTGGSASVMLAWLPVVAIDAATSGSRRVAGFSAGIATAGLGIIWGVAAAGWSVPQAPWPPSAALICLILAVLWSGITAMRVVALDRAAERAARIGEERYRLLAEHVTDLITRHRLDGGVEFASPSARRLLGVRIADLLGDGLFRRVHLPDRPIYLTALSDALNRGAQVAAEYRLRRADADGESLVWVETRYSLAEEGDQRVVVAVTRDIAERKANELAISEAREAAEAANAAKSRFLAQMSHELRTPLNAIIGFSEILTNELFGQLPNSRHRDYARLIHSSGEHLLQVVNDLLDMSKIEAGKFRLLREPFDVAELVNTCCELMECQAGERRLTIIKALAPDIPPLNGDQRACKQILINLLSNAVKFSHPGGEIRVGARREGRFVVFVVEDRGIGISPDDLPRLGTPFVQADSSYNRRYQGTGLGLSVVKGLATLHGGNVQIRSELDRGTVVTVTLPLDADVDTNAAETETGPAQIEERKRA